MKPDVLLLCAILFLVVMYLLTSCTLKCSEKTLDSFTRFDGPPYTSSCEFQPACLWDTARWVQLSNGMSGVCTLHGIACPAFSKDHDRVRNMGLSPTTVSDNYMQRLKRYSGENRESFNIYNPALQPGSDISGQSYDEDEAVVTALELGM